MVYDRFDKCVSIYEELRDGLSTASSPAVERRPDRHGDELGEARGARTYREMEEQRRSVSRWWSGEEGEARPQGREGRTSSWGLGGVGREGEAWVYIGGGGERWPVQCCSIGRAQRAGLEASGDGTGAQAQRGARRDDGDGAAAGGSGAGLETSGDAMATRGDATVTVTARQRRGARRGGGDGDAAAVRWDGARHGSTRGARARRRQQSTVAATARQRCGTVMVT
uniref:Uncharacterized protein n=1 Tax=Oryza rufipogon TaxID=4529 RepID=A0A0E0QVH9_ORYRU